MLQQHCQHWVWKRVCEAAIETKSEMGGKAAQRMRRLGAHTTWYYTIHAKVIINVHEMDHVGHVRLVGNTTELTKPIWRCLLLLLDCGCVFFFSEKIFGVGVIASSVVGLCLYVEFCTYYLPLLMYVWYVFAPGQLWTAIPYSTLYEYDDIFPREASAQSIARSLSFFLAVMSMMVLLSHLNLLYVCVFYHFSPTV